MKTPTKTSNPPSLIPSVPWMAQDRGTFCGHGLPAACGFGWGSGGRDLYKSLPPGLQADTVLDGLNRYAYCGNNPINYVDPTGNWTDYSDSSKGRQEYEWRPQSYTAWDGTIQFYKYNDKGEKRSPNGIFSHTGTNDSSDSNSNGNDSGNDSKKDHDPVNENKPSSLPSLGSSENENTPHTQYMGLFYCCNPLFFGIDLINKMTIGYAPFYDGIEGLMDGLCFLTIDRFHDYSSYSHKVYSGRDKQMTQFGTYIAITLSLVPGAGSLDDAARLLKIDQRTLQHMFGKHAKDFGITGNWSKATAAEFEKLLRLQIETVKPICGTYRGTQQVLHYFNSSTGTNVMTDMSGNLIGGWKLSADQIIYLLTTGAVK